MMKITFINQLRVLAFHIIGTCLMILCVSIFHFEKAITIIFLSFWILYTIPVLYLHIKYFLKNKGENIEIYPDKIVVSKENKIQSYPNTEILKVITYKSASNTKGGFPLFPWELYYYSKIITKNYGEIIITCLMSTELEDEVKKLVGVDYELKKGFGFFLV